ncbi:MAG: ACP S-malonyltransferase [Verrucomicrobiae bacterium]|nr:ACP S-malonyltransferase [Verrucomicrobiae bacterium]
MSQKIALLFSGQGAQKVGMGADLMDQPICREIFEEANRILGYELTEVCFQGPETKLTETRYCQPALYVHGLACWAALRSKVEITPSFAAGLSLGEFTAHAAAGSFSFSEGLKLVSIRGAAMQKACEQSAGGMVSLIGATSEQAQEMAKKSDVDVANYNCPGQIVLSGLSSNLEVVPALAKEMGIKRALPLKVAGAYHSRLMKPAREELAQALAGVSWEELQFPVVANYTAQSVSDSQAIASLLLEQVTGSVRWEESIRYLKAQGVSHFIELGPGEVIAGLLKRIDPELQITSISDAVSLEKGIVWVKENVEKLEKV